MAHMSRQVHLRRRPVGAVTRGEFDLVDVQLPDLQPGEVLVENAALSVDPYMRPRMNDVPSYVPPFRVGAVLEGGAVGTVVASEAPETPVGTWVLHMAGWRDKAVLRAGSFRTIDLRGLPPSYFLGVLGMPGLTAYAGLFDVAGLKPGESIFISGAAGAVGGLVGQFARLSGADYVIGSAGTADKVRFLETELGFERAFNYRDRPVLDSLRAAAPTGIDIYFDNVGGDHFSAALDVLNPYGRVAMCGTVSSYDGEPSSVPANLFKIVAKRIKVQGFIVSDHDRLADEFERTVSSWITSNQLVVREHVWHGIDSMPDAFLGMLGGANTGKVIVDLWSPAEALEP